VWNTRHVVPNFQGMFFDFRDGMKGNAVIKSVCVLVFFPADYGDAWFGVGFLEVYRLVHTALSKWSLAAVFGFGLCKVAIACCPCMCVAWRSRACVCFFFEHRSTTNITIIQFGSWIWFQVSILAHVKQKNTPNPHCRLALFFLVFRSAGFCQAMLWQYFVIKNGFEI